MPSRTHEAERPEATGLTRKGSGEMESEIEFTRVVVSLLKDCVREPTARTIDQRGRVDGRSKQPYNRQSRKGIPITICNAAIADGRGECSLVDGPWLEIRRTDEQHGSSCGDSRPAQLILWSTSRHSAFHLPAQKGASPHHFQGHVNRNSFYGPVECDVDGAAAIADRVPARIHCGTFRKRNTCRTVGRID
jgi:hypothetical protein